MVPCPVKKKFLVFGPLFLYCRKGSPHFHHSTLKQCALMVNFAQADLMTIGKDGHSIGFIVAGQHNMFLLFLSFVTISILQSCPQVSGLCQMKVQMKVQMATAVKAAQALADTWRLLWGELRRGLTSESCPPPCHFKRVTLRGVFRIFAGSEIPKQTRLGRDFAFEKQQRGWPVVHWRAEFPSLCRAKMAMIFHCTVQVSLLHFANFYPFF